MASVEIFPCVQRLRHLMYLEAFLLVSLKLCCIFLLFFSNNPVYFIYFLKNCDILQLKFNLFY
jgi:hypothetical protein